MTAEPLLTVDGHAISLKQALTYLQNAGRLQPLVRDILCQYVIEKELQSDKNAEVSSVATEQAIIEFRLQNQLTDLERFQQWLAANQMDYETFHRQIAGGYRLSRLKARITEPQFQEYFIERKIFLDRVVLSRIVVETQALAEELAIQLSEGASFEQLARQYSKTDDCHVNGMMGYLSRGTLPDRVRTLVDQANAGDVLPPLELDQQWMIFRVDQILPASSEDPALQQVLQNELFERWLAEKLQTMNVTLHLNESP